MSLSPTRVARSKLYFSRTTMRHFATLLHKIAILLIIYTLITLEFRGSIQIVIYGNKSVIFNQKAITQNSSLIVFCFKTPRTSRHLLKRIIIVLEIRLAGIRLLWGWRSNDQLIISGRCDPPSSDVPTV